MSKDSLHIEEQESSNMQIIESTQGKGEVSPTPKLIPENQKIIPSLSSIRIEMNEEELDSPGARRLIIGQLVQCMEQKNKLEKYVELFHTSDKQKDVLAEKLVSCKKVASMQNFLYALGGALIGLSPNLISLGYTPPLSILTLGILTLFIAMNRRGEE